MNTADTGQVHFLARLSGELDLALSSLRRVEKTVVAICHEADISNEQYRELQGLDYVAQAIDEIRLVLLKMAAAEEANGHWKVEEIVADLKLGAIAMRLLGDKVSAQGGKADGDVIVW